MTSSHSPDPAAIGLLTLSSEEIDNLLSMILIASLATLDDDGCIHLMPMWFVRMGDYLPPDADFMISRHSKVRKGS